MSPESKNVLAFGPYRIDREQRLLTKGTEVIPLAPKVFDTLLTLAESGGRIVEKQDLIDKVWPDAFVEEGSLTRNISTLRKAIGESSQDQKYIVTVPKRGYRFIARVTDRGAIGTAREGTAIYPEPNMFVGRECETGRLSEHFQRMLRGAGNLVFLSGEAGIGKSALAGEFISSMRRRHPELMVASGRAIEQYGTVEAYLPFLDALDTLVREGSDAVAAKLRVYAPTWCLQLSAFTSSSDLDQLRRETAGATKDRMLREMGDALGALSQDAPLLLLLEDLHWADASTVDLLRYLSHRIAMQRVLLLATFRPEGLQIGPHPLKNCKIELQTHHQCEEISLHVLSADELASLLHLRFTPNDFPSEFASLIRKRTDGQPLFTVSLLEFLTRRGEIALTNSHWSLTRPLGEMVLEIPDSVRAMIRKKSEMLDAGSRLALQYASVEGEEFLSTVLASFLESDEVKVEEQLAALSKTHRLIEWRGEEELPDGVLATRYAFAHALYQNVFYEELVSTRRVLLHARAGEELLRHYGDRAPRVAVQLAMHFELGRSWARAIEFLLLAGANASDMNANIQAEEIYTRALGLASKLAPQERAEAERRIYERRAGVYLAMSRFDQSIGDCREMIERARTIGSVALECVALWTLGNTLFWAHRLFEMQAVLGDVIRLAERTQGETARVQALALMAQGHLALGELREADIKFQEVIDQPTPTDRRTLLGVLDVGARLRYFQSEYAAAEKLFRETMTLASELGNAFEMLKSHYFLCLSLANMGRISEAMEVLNRATEAAKRNGDFYWSARVPNCLGWIHRELQDYSQAIVFDSEGASAAHNLCVGEAEVNSVLNLVLDHCHTGDRKSADSAIASAESIMSRDPWFRWRFELRYHAARAEQTLSKSDVLRLMEKSTQHRARKYTVTAHTLLARIAMAEGDMAGAEAQLHAGVAILHEFPAPLVAWKTYLIQGRLYAMLGRGDAARAAFREAADTIAHIVVHISDERLRGVFLGSSEVQEVVAQASS